MLNIDRPSLTIQRDLFVVERSASCLDESPVAATWQSVSRTRKERFKNGAR